MPRYEYACTSPECGNKFELVQSFTDPAASECPACGHGVRKVYGSVGVVFKGSGFYRTDSRADSRTGANGGKAEGGKADGSSDKSGGSGKSADAKSSPSKTGGSKASTGSSGSSSSSRTNSSSSAGSSKAAVS